MKKCNTCGTTVEDTAGFCTKCGSTDIVELKKAKAASLENGNGNIVAGVVGAFLFSVVGALLYFVVYQLGIIAGICGLAMFVLAGFGYRLLAGTKNQASVAGIIVSVIVSAIMIYIAEYFCVSYEIFVAYKEEVDITIFDAIRVTPEFLSEPEIRDAVVSDLLFAYIFGFLAIISNIVSAVKAKKNAAAAAEANLPQSNAEEVSKAAEEEITETAGTLNKE